MKWIDTESNPILEVIKYINCKMTNFNVFFFNFHVERGECWGSSLTTKRHKWRIQPQELWISTRKDSSRSVCFQVQVWMLRCPIEIKRLRLFKRQILFNLGGLFFLFDWSYFLSTQFHICWNYHISRTFRGIS